MKGRNNNNNISISLARARELMKHSHNSDDVSSVFKLDFDEFGSPEALSFVGEALRTNTHIKWLEIDFHNKLVPAEGLEGLLYFISNCPSLLVLRLSDVHQSAQVQHLLMDAAAESKSVQKVSINTMYYMVSPPALTQRLEVPASLKELTLHGLPESLAHFWPVHHRIETLGLLKCSHQTEAVYQSNLSDFLQMLARTERSRSIQKLHVSAWSSSLPTFLLSPKSAVQALSLTLADFCHTAGGSSAMDGLLWGLAGSKTTSDLILDTCAFDRLASQKLIQGLHSEILSIKCLNIVDCGNLDGKDFQELFSCRCLGSLKCGSVNDNFDAMVEGLQSSSLRALGFQTDQELADLGPNCKAALAALNQLEIDGYDLTDETNRDYLLNVLEDEECQLQRLCLDGFDEEDLHSIPTLMDALGKCPQMESFGLKTNKEGKYVKQLFRGVENFSKLKVLEVVFGSDKSLSPKLQQQAVESILCNWNLEQVRIGCNICASSLLLPIITPATQKKLDSITQRNKLMKQIDSIEVADLSLGEKVEWMNHLQAMWALPDSLTLAFSLLQSRPGCFF